MTLKRTRNVELLTREERLEAVARILALGLLRLHMRCQQTERDNTGLPAAPKHSSWTPNQLKLKENGHD